MAITIRLRHGLHLRRDTNAPLPTISCLRGIGLAKIYGQDREVLHNLRQNLKKENIKIMDYNSIPFRNRDIDVITKRKEGPNRIVSKRITTLEDGSTRVGKEVVNKRGYKSVEKIDGKRTSIGKSY
jgi:hypothetical protein